MYHHIRGPLIRKEPDLAVVEAGGVGYALSISLATYDSLPDEGREATLYTYLYVREDQLRLYGFGEERERDFFELLLSVNGVGPSVSLTILSSAPIGDIQQAILTENIAFLKKIKGIGRKTAQKIHLELRDKVGKIRDVASPEKGSPLAANMEDAVLSLVALGYSEEASRQAVQKANQQREDDDNPPTEELVRGALQYIQ